MVLITHRGLRSFAAHTRRVLVNMEGQPEETTSDVHLYGRRLREKPPANTGVAQCNRQIVLHEIDPRSPSFETLAVTMEDPPATQGS